MRRTMAWLLICCFLVWGPLEMLPLACAARLSRSVFPVSPARVACVCRMCASARNAQHKACCCTHAHSSAEKLVMQAQCDNSHSDVLVVKAKFPVALPLCFAPAICEIYLTPHVFPYAPTLRVLTPEPSDPPPCHG